MRPTMMFLILCCAPLVAQQTATTQKAAERQPMETPNQQKLFVLKYADPERLAGLISVFSANGASVRSNSEMHALAVTAPNPVMQAIEEAIAKLDVPSASPKDFDFTIYLVVGTETDNIGTAVIPKDLDAVITQLRGSFPFKNYRLLDTLTMRSRAGQSISTTSSGGAVTLGNVSRLATAHFSLRSATLSPDSATIRLENMNCRIFVPYEEAPGHYSQNDLQLNTDLDVKEGQKVVVGRMGMSSQQAMFVVITVKVVQ
ncbi:MAG TPA: secretin N-terminal domain-containing protein [Verrucomicrobiae bacterium]|nr:secretin N-terminal domain-containing protein [Verrucomicrobiae bacterium]